MVPATALAVFAFAAAVLPLAAALAADATDILVPAVVNFSGDTVGLPTTPPPPPPPPPPPSLPPVLGLLVAVAVPVAVAAVADVGRPGGVAVSLVLLAVVGLLEDGVPVRLRVAVAAAATAATAVVGLLEDAVGLSPVAVAVVGLLGKKGSSKDSICMAPFMYNEK